MVVVVVVVVVVLVVVVVVVAVAVAVAVVVVVVVAVGRGPLYVVEDTAERVSIDISQVAEHFLKIFLLHNFS